MAKEMQQAAQIQLGLLPKEAPKLAGLEVAGRMVPARTVGGDYCQRTSSHSRTDEST